MTPAARLLFAVTMGLWLLLLIGTVRAHRLAPKVDLAGTWAGTIAAAALLFGRVGYGLAWALALLLVCLMVAIGLYDRAVLLPSLEAAVRRADHDAKWEEEWRFLRRMAAWGRGLMVAKGLVAFAAGLVA